MFVLFANRVVLEKNFVNLSIPVDEIFASSRTAPGHWPGESGEFIAAKQLVCESTGCAYVTFLI